MASEAFNEHVRRAREARAAAQEQKEMGNKARDQGDERRAQRHFDSSGQQLDRFKEENKAADRLAGTGCPMIALPVGGGILYALVRGAIKAYEFLA